MDTEFHPGKQPDVCPPQGVTRGEMAQARYRRAQPVRDMIADLVSHHVAITQHARRLRSLRWRASAARAAIPRRAVARSAPLSYLSARARAPRGDDTPTIRRCSKELRIRIRLRQGRRTADVRRRPHRQRRRARRIRRSAQYRTAGGRRIHARRGHPNRDFERRQISRRTGPLRHRSQPASRPIWW